MKAKIKYWLGDFPDFLTYEKEYDVISFDGRGFDFLDDVGEWNYTNVKKSWVLNGGDWEIVE